jgi:CubicO group peptidase (beta-lactamase class C family)
MLTAEDAGAFLDGALPPLLKSQDIAGAVVLIVKDDKVLLSKGYGYADVARKTPVSPEYTLFRPGSISKLFTWTAVMQLVEEGKLDLDGDVNGYLDFTVPRKFGRPITLRNLLTHTPGFEETVKELFVSSAMDLKPLDSYLKAHLPKRIFPPGVIPAYSNYGAALAGYMVERVSGQPFADYVDTHIFKPLGMVHSTFRQPLPESFVPFMAEGYLVASQPARPFEMVQAAPAGSSSVTAADMARFTIAHLNNGRFGGGRILKPETVRLMHSLQLENLPGMNGMALGFYEESRNGHRIIGHGGDTICFHSDLHLVTDAGIGFFISLNSAGKGAIDVRSVVWEAFLDRYFPYTTPAVSPPSSAAEDARAVSGRYISSRRAETTLMKVTMLLGQVNVHRNADGTLGSNAAKEINGQPMRFSEIAPMVFQAVNGQNRVGFKRDDSGSLVAVADAPIMIFQRVPWNENSALHLTIIISVIAVFVLTLLFWPAAALIRRHYKRTLALDRPRKTLRLLTRLVPVIDLVFLAGFAVIFMSAQSNIGLLSARMDPWIRVVQLIGWLGVVGTPTPLSNAARSWAEKGRGPWSRLGDTLIALACMGFLWFVLTWNVLAWNLMY